MKVFIIGFMACGKSRTGRIMASESGRRFIDLDKYIADREHRTISEIFRDDGSEKFRKLETMYLREVCDLYEDFILSVGGGTPCFNNNMELMNSLGETIFLNPDVDTITNRLILGKYKRPLVKDLQDEAIRAYVVENLKARMPFYMKATKIISE